MFSLDSRPLRKATIQGAGVEANLCYKENDNYSSFTHSHIESIHKKIYIIYTLQTHTMHVLPLHYTSVPRKPEWLSSRTRFISCSSRNIVRASERGAPSSMAKLESWAQSVSDQRSSSMSDPFSRSNILEKVGLSSCSGALRQINQQSACVHVVSCIQ